MTRVALWAMILAVTSCSMPEQPPPGAGPAGAAALPAVLDQGWTGSQRATFYDTSQGSRILPAAWFAALQMADGSGPFGGDGLARYGYLQASASKYPIGFVEDPRSGDLGMTCAACHTGAIRYRGQVVRIDGGRSHADFQAFLADLAASLRATQEPARFDAFATAVLGPARTPSATRSLETALRAKAAEFGHFMDRSLPPEPWGKGRLDAFGMIFNRVVALGLGVEENYSFADAPVRYPFIWNAPFQDATQWTGAAPNGRFIKGLARNTGEVFGVFGGLHPTRDRLGLVRYASTVEFRNLVALESAVAALRPPRYPFPIDRALAERGKGLWGSECAACHARQASTSLERAWTTPVCRVWTDRTTFDKSRLDAATGLLRGTYAPSTGRLLGDRAPKLDLLATAVIGALVESARFDGALSRSVRADLENAVDPRYPGAITDGTAWPQRPECTKAPPRPAIAAASSLDTGVGARAAMPAAQAGLYQIPAAGAQTGEAAYESRVLEGVWAAAPYLHNGSVPSLWQLLLPAKDRVSRFPTGLVEFDPVDVGLTVSPGGDFDASRSPNGNAGHEYGTTLPEADRRALLEYLKTL